jgi:hypothetical protein
MKQSALLPALPPVLSGLPWCCVFLPPLWRVFSVSAVVVPVFYSQLFLIFHTGACIEVILNHDVHMNIEVDDSIYALTNLLPVWGTFVLFYLLAKSSY